MTNIVEDFIQSNVGINPVSRVRRNHGLEHATLHVLSERYPKLNMAGHSNTSGFWLIGDVPTEAIREAANEALQRMRNGEHNLAVHPNCGTNFVSAGTVAGVLGALAMFGVGRNWRDRLERLPLAATLATLGLILSQPLGLLMQEKFTTSGEPGNLEIVDVIQSNTGRIPAHRVITKG